MHHDSTTPFARSAPTPIPGSGTPATRRSPGSWGVRPFGGVVIAGALLSLLVFGTGTVRAQWSSDSAANLSVADGSGDQILPKLVPSGDGGMFVSWFDAIGNGFDVRLQKLDAAGNEVLSHNGVLVADRGFSSVQDYGLDIDAVGNALLAFRDDSGAGVQITANMVSPAGALLWGATGVQLTATAAFVASPKIAGTSDGGAVVAWTQDNTTRLQRLDAAGSPVWGADVVLTPGTGSFSVSDLHDAGNDVILSYIHQTGGFGSPRHIRAQKYDASGAGLWGASGVAVFDGGSLQIANFPPFVPDTFGGAFFSWYSTSGPLQCHAQHILFDGTEAYGHNGVVASTNATRVRVSPSIAHDAATNTAYLFWTEQNSVQSLSGLYGQRFDASGNRLWTNDGAALIPLGASSITEVRTIAADGRAFVFWEGSPSFGSDRLFGAGVDPAGSIDIGPFDVASTPSSKLRVQAARSPLGHVVLAWGDDRVDAGDVLVQNVNQDGSLGTPVTSVGEGSGFGGDLRAGTSYPNPSRGSVDVRFRLDGGGEGARPGRPGTVDTGEWTLEIVDATGRLVLEDRLRVKPGGAVFTWDGRTGRGEQAPAGAYWVRVPGWTDGAVRVVRLD